jgi:very-short-patch-repair endonuclease
MSVFDDAPFKYSLEDIKKTISDATSWEDFKEKNTNINSMRNYININYKNDPDNNWESLISHFDDAPFKFSLEGIKKKISDATSWEDFKQKNPNFNSMRNYINQNHKNDSYNNWESLTSVFNDYPTKFSLEGIKKKISDATSWEDFKQKNPNWINMYLYIRKNYKNDPDNNWESLISHFDDRYVERRYQTKSESKGEKKVKSSLIDLGYDVSTQKRFKGCYGFKGKRYCDLLKFDAYVEKKNGKKVCVEFDGEQHFMSVGIFGGDIRLEEQQKHDQLKNNYCKNNGVKLIRIHYLDFKKIEEILKNELGPYEQENMDNNMDMGIFYSRPEEYQHLT